MFYATVNDEGIVNGVSDLAGKVNDPLMIEISHFDQSLMGKRWTGTEFVDSGIVPPAPVDPLADISAKLDKIDADLTEVKADVKIIKAR